MCIDPHQTGFVGKGSDHLQLIKFWPSHAQRRGRAKIFGSALLQAVRSVCISLSVFFICLVFRIHLVVNSVDDTPRQVVAKARYEIVITPLIIHS